MSWNLETAKKYLDLESDDTKDEYITDVMTITLQAIETALARKLLLQRNTVRFFKTRSESLPLSPYPITEVFDINGEGVPSDLLIHHENGIIEHPTLACKKTLDVDFEGGYDPLPSDLERVMWDAFMLLWSNTNQTTGGPPETGSGIVSGSGDVKSLTVFDGFKMDFDVGVTNTSSDTSLASQQADWGWLAPWASTLSMYRSDYGVGGIGVV